MLKWFSVVFISLGWTEHELQCVVAGVPHHGVVLHVAGFTDGFVLLHHVGLSGQNAVTVEAAEVLQMPVLPLGLSVLVTEDQLETNGQV